MARGTTPPAVTPQMFKEIFEDHPSGRIVLEHLIGRFVRPSVTEGGIDAVLKTYQRIGQRVPLDYIVTQLNRANGATNLEGEPDDPQ